MKDFDLTEVTRKSIQGVFALVSRTLIIQIITLVVGFLLTIFLSPSAFGVFFVVSAIIPFLQYFSDIGLAAALVQKKDSITEKDLKTTFTIQQSLVITIVLIALLLSSKVGKFYNLEGAGIYLFQAVVIAFFLSSLKTIPSVILERRLDFKKLVVPQIIEELFFNVVVLVLAIKGFGITSFTYAVLARGFSGLITIYLIAPWRIGLGFSKESAKKLLSFGVPFQLNSVLALIKDDLLVVYLGKVLPLAQVGYIGFAQKLAFKPLRLVMDNIIRITFPSFSRLQHDKGALSIAIEKSLFAVSFFTFPALFGLVILSPYLINAIPKYKQWEPALLSLSFFAINGFLSSLSTPLTNALNAIGKIKITLYLMIFWTIATWVLTPLGILFFGFNGVAIVSAIIALSVVLVVYITKRHISFDIFQIIRWPFFSAFLMGSFLYLVSPIIIQNILTLLLMVLLGAILYLSVIFLLAREQIRADINLVKKNLLAT